MDKFNDKFVDELLGTALEQLKQTAINTRDLNVPEFNQISQEATGKIRCDIRWDFLKDLLSLMIMDRNK